MIIPYSERSGKENMKIDEELLYYAISHQLDKPIFRLYGWSPACVSLGRNQSEDFINMNYLNSQNIDIVRRITGGRALFHDNEITYCFITPINILKNGESVLFSYREISQFLVNSFEEVSISLEYGQKIAGKNANDYCMLLSTGADLCYCGKKLIGSAQCRKQGYILQHGSILYDYNKDLLSRIFPSTQVFDDITSIKNISSTLTKDTIIEILTKNINKIYNLQ